MEINIGVSNRHVHLTKEDLEKLFGSDYTLEVLRDLTQPNQYASTAIVTIKTSKSEINNVRILGPVRNYTQVEISKTDAYKLGLNPPIRNSGDLEGSCGITIVGPIGEITIPCGCIIPTRHIHLTTKQLIEKGFENINKVDVKINGDKGGIINNVYLKTSENAYFEMHIDTDDANAHLIKNGDKGEIL